MPSELAQLLANRFATYPIGEAYAPYFTKSGDWRESPPKIETTLKVLDIIGREVKIDLATAQRCYKLAGKYMQRRSSPI